MDNKTKLTKEQQKWVENNLGLIYSYMIANNLDRDVYEDILYLAICKAALSYDPQKGTVGAYCYKVFDNTVYKKYRYDTEAMRNQVPIYLDQYDADTKDGSDTFEKDFLELQAQPIESIEDEITTKVAYNKWLNDLSKKHKQLVMDLIKYKNQEKIAEAYGVTQSAVNAQAQIVKRSFKKAMKGERYV